MTGLSTVLLVIAGLTCALAIPSSLLTDVKQAEARSRLTNKVKRAQEVIMFGNQQNRVTGRNGFSGIPRAEKRGVGVGVDENVLVEATERPRTFMGEDDSVEEPKVMALGYPQEYAAPGRLVRPADYYADPGLTDLRYYNLDERRKRETFRTPSKRSSRGMASRAKRDLDLDPEELLALISYWETELRNKNRNMYNQYSVEADDLDSLDNVDNELADDEEPKQDGWLEGPVALPSRHFSVGAEPWGRQRFPDDRRKRYMVAKRRPQDGDMYALAQMLNAPHQMRDMATPVFRRYVL